MLCEPRVSVEHARGELACLGDQLAVLHDAQQLELDRPPDWMPPSTSPSLPQLEVHLGEFEPVERGGHGIHSLARERSRPRPPSRTGTDPGRHRARPGRAAGAAATTPNRSASRMTIVDAFGTSTPTSMTVVATSTSISPRGERAHDARPSRRSACGRAAPRCACPRAAGSAQHRREGLGHVRGRAGGGRRARASAAGSVGGRPSASGPPQRDRSPGTPRTPAAPARAPRRDAPTPAPTHPGFSASGTTCDAIGAAARRAARAIVEMSRSPNTVIATVRGIGVAVSTSTCGGCAPLSRSASRWSTPKRCCSSTTTSPRSKNCTVLAEQRVGADDDGCRRPTPRRAVALRVSATGSCPVSSVGRSSRREVGTERLHDRAQVLARRAPRSARAARTARPTRRPRASPAARRASCPSRPRPARAGSSACRPRGRSRSRHRRVAWSPVSSNGSAASNSARASRPARARSPRLRAKARALLQQRGLQHERLLEAQRLPRRAASRNPSRGRWMSSSARGTASSPRARARLGHRVSSAGSVSSTSADRLLDLPARDAWRLRGRSGSGSSAQALAAVGAGARRIVGVEQLVVGVRELQRLR